MLPDLYIFLCTCPNHRNAPVPAFFDPVSDEWCHVDDVGDFYLAWMDHVHVDENTKDCDGPLDRFYVVRPWVESENHVVDGLSLLLRVAESFLGNGDRGTIEWNTFEPSAIASWTHDEGGGSAGLRLCRDPECAHERYTQRDHFAEAMGY